MKEKIFVSKDNVFSDLGLDDSDEMKARSDLMSEVVSIIRNSDVPQKEFAIILGISVPKVSALMSGKINDFSNDTLMKYLRLLGCNVEIKVLHQFQISNSIQKGVMKVERSITKKRATKIRKRRVKSKA
jgi:predicted XRE-type DNA-binding protein